jgi:hypothetical protein
MKEKLLFFCLFLCLSAYSQQNKITFNYDPAGNQTFRVYCLAGCSAKPSKEIKEIEALVEEDMQKFFPEDNISYYPNPVKEEFYIKWEFLENKVSSIYVYGSTGQALKSFSNLENNANQNISFQQYPTGIYLVVLNYSNGEKKTIKIIKQ